MTAWHWIRQIFWDATWGNNVAWLESLLIAGVTVTVFRDRIGRHVAQWWNKHHHEHMVMAHLEALRRHDEAQRKLDEMEANVALDSDSAVPGPEPRS